MASHRASSSPLEIRVLGPLEVLVDGAPLRVDTRKALALVALLAVEGRPFARDELAAMLWPESDDESARGALRRTLSVLRAGLGGRWLEVGRSSVGLPLGPGTWLDLAALDTADDGPAGLAAAASLARGPFLAGFSLRDSPDFDDWRATRAVTVERRLAAVLERLAETAAAGGDVPAAVGAAARLVELDPLDEPARRRLMTLLARSGDRTGAIREYRATVAVLEHELGVAPLAATTELYEAIRDDRLAADALAASPAPARAAVLPMLGRDAELALLLRTATAVGPDGRLALVTGEAGIGKSRLVEALADAVTRRGGRPLVARAYPAEGAIAYAPVVELLRSGLADRGATGRLARLPASSLAELGRLVALPEGPGLALAPPPADPPAARARLLDAVAAALVTLSGDPAGGAGLVAVEDVQWADDASREALLYLARRLAGRAILLVLTWRPEDLDGRGLAFAGAVGAVAAGDGAVAIRLDRLPPADVSALVAAAGSPWDPSALAHESEGLPLYVVEALAAGPAEGAGTVPRGVRALLHERVGSVSEMAGQVLAAAAVLGRSFDLDVVRGVSGRSEDEAVAALEELVRRAIVREVAGAGEVRYDFAHARLREAAYERTGLARRRLLHRRAAEGLRGWSGDRDDPGRLAQVAAHELAAGRDAEAAATFRDAGLRARAVHANREALAHLEAALALGHPDERGLLVTIGELRTATGDYAGAVAALETAAATAAGPDLARIEQRLGRVHAWRGDVAAAASHLDAAISLGVPADLGPLLVERGAVALRAGDLALAGRLASDALALGDPRSTGAARRLIGLVALRRGDLPAARSALEAALATVDGSADPDESIAVRNALALVEAAAGRRAVAVGLLEEALADCRRTGQVHLEAAVENNLADQLHAMGRTDEAMAHLKHAVARFAEVGGRASEPEPEIWKLVAW